MEESRSSEAAACARRGRKQMRSCDICYRRKVRCDSVDKEPCSACRRSRVECRFTRQWKQAVKSRSSEITNQHSEDDNLGTPGQQGVPGPSNASLSSSNLTARPDSSPLVTTQARDVGVGSDVVISHIISQDLVRSCLSEFLSISAAASTWDVLDHTERVRIAYIGTEISNLTHLLDLEQTAPPELHHPYPHIKPPLGWKPDINSGGNLLSQNLLNDLCSFPAKDVRDDLVESFFTHIHPYFPIIDESRFRAQYNNPRDPPPLLVLQSVLLAGAHASHHPRVVQARSTVKAVIFRRAKTLFDMRHENDRLHLIQAALLFSWHIENADNVSSNGWHWVGIACRISLGSGIQRDLSRYSALKFSDQMRRLYRRVWWCVFQVEIMSALEHGRPCMIHLEDFDQPPLEMDDLREGDGVINNNIKFDYSSRKIELCYIALEVLRLSSPGAIGHANSAAVQSVNSRLVAWALSNVLGNDYESLSLHIFYQTIVIHWHRTSMNTCVLGKDQSVEVRKAASRSILVNFEALAAQNLLFRCHFIEVVSLTAVAIQTHQEIKSAIDQRQTLQAINGLNDLERILRVAKAMAEYWPNAEAVYKLFKELSEKLRISAIRDNGSANDNQGFGENTNSLGDINWHYILAYQPLEQSIDEGWLNDIVESRGMG